MCKHEEKHCPRCKIVFECKPGSITQCQCSAVSLSQEERAYIEAAYEDCLCIHCLLGLQQLFSKRDINRDYSKADYLCTNKQDDI